MTKLFYLLALLIFPSIIFIPAECYALGRTGVVVRVVDGDTINVAIDGRTYRVRLLCIDSPEKKPNEKSFKDSVRLHEDESLLNAAGVRSTNFVRALVKPGEKVTLEYDKQVLDMYSRVLAYVYVTDGTFLNEKIISEGYAGVLCYAPNDKFAKRFITDLQNASSQKKGLWKDGITLQNRWVR